MGKDWKTCHFNREPLPLLNLKTETLEGEMWKPIEALEGGYEISNL